MPVPFFDYRPELKTMRGEIDAAVARVLDSGSLILDREVTEFETEFAEWTGAGHAVGVSSGTDALILALRAVGVAPGDEVITQANTAWPTVAAILWIGAVPRFADIDPATLQLDPRAVGDAITRRTRCILPVHLYGVAAPIVEIMDVARRHDLRVVEDCAQAFGTRVNGRHVGLFGDVGCFSFYPTKNLGGFGDGGMCVTNDSGTAEALGGARAYGWDESRVSVRQGTNARLDELQAAMLSVKLRHIAPALARRYALAALYDKGLADSPVGLHARPVGSAPHLYIVRSSRRTELRSHLARLGIGTAIHYERAAHRHPVLNDLGPFPALPETERACDEVLSLPLYPGLTEDQARQVIRAILDFAGTD